MHFAPFYCNLFQPALLKPDKVQCNIRNHWQLVVTHYAVWRWFKAGSLRLVEIKMDKATLKQLAEAAACICSHVKRAQLSIIPMCAYMWGLPREHRA
jgi:hypothetical protein